MNHIRDWKLEILWTHELKVATKNHEYTQKSCKPINISATYASKTSKQVRRRTKIHSRQPDFCCGFFQNFNEPRSKDNKCNIESSLFSTTLITLLQAACFTDFSSFSVLELSWVESVFHLSISHREKGEKGRRKGKIPRCPYIIE